MTEKNEVLTKNIEGLDCTPATLNLNLPKWAIDHIYSVTDSLAFDNINDCALYLIRKHYENNIAYK
jgi:hypothetical protein